MDFREYTPEGLLGPLNDVELKNAPESLFVTGDIRILKEGARVSIVGSRKATGGGKQRAGRLARLLAERGVVVVSGLAEGIDTAAHQSTIDSGGRTVGIIGTPLDKAYPKKNAELQNRIAIEHVLISQFPIGYPVQPKNFPLRNRTMALVADVTVIMEATRESGSLHQGWEALRLGRGLFIAKSIIEANGVTWPDKFLHYGARILSDESLDELFDFLPPRTVAEFHDSISF